MSDKKIIAVVGATGSQGGGLVRAITSDPRRRFTARALTRDVESAAARALAAGGAEVVAMDLGDTDSIRRAFDGAYGAFCVTFFWAHYQPEREVAEATAMAQAAKDRSVHHVLWSTLEDTRLLLPLEDDRMPVLMGKYNVPHYDGKGEANAVFTTLGVPTTFFHTSFYWDNLIHFGMGPKRGDDGRLQLTLPMADKRLPGMAAEDIGKCAFGVFAAGDEFIGQSIAVAGEHLSGAQMAASLSRALGEEVVYNAVTPAQFRGFGFPGAEDLGNMFQYKSDFESEYTASRDLRLARRLNPELQTFDQWLERNASRIPIE